MILLPRVGVACDLAAIGGRGAAVFVILSPSPVILSPSLVILSEAKDLSSSLRVNFAKHLGIYGIMQMRRSFLAFGSSG
jgi:hypothetical protein